MNLKMPTIIMKPILFYYILLFIIFKTIYSQNSTIYLNFPFSIKLSNENIFIIHQDGVSIYDPTFSYLISQEVIFSESEKIHSTFNLSKVTVSQFENGYIVSIINDKIYFFDYKGNFIFESDQINLNNTGEYYSLVPIKIFNGYYYCVIGYIADNVLYIYYFKFDLEKKYNVSFKLYTDFKYKKGEKICNFEGNALSCQLMSISFNENNLICFFMTECDSNSMVTYFLSVNENDIKNNGSELINIKMSNITTIKSVVNSIGSKIFVCFFVVEKTCYCFTYKSSDVNNDITINLKKLFNEKCNIDYYSMKVGYIKGKEEFIISSLGIDGSIQTRIYNNSMGMTIKVDKFNNCTYIYGYSILYSVASNEYYDLSDIKCEDKKYPFNILTSKIEDSADENVYQTNFISSTSIESFSENIRATALIQTTSDISKNDYCDNEKLEINNLSEKIINCYFNKIKGEDIVINEDNNIVFTITTTKKQKMNENKNITTINLGECENRLKDNYKIQKDNPLYIIKIDIKEEGMKIPKVEYEIYYPLYGNIYEKLDLSLCEDIKILISIPVSINEDDIDKYNSSSSFYNDICSTYTSNNGTDVSLDDRQKEFIENNMTLCEEDCTLTGYDTKTEKALCSCNVKIKLPLISEIKFNKTKLFDNFININNMINLKVMKCYHVLLTEEGILKNIGIYIIFPIIIFHRICIILFYMKDYKKIENIVNIIVDSFKNKEKKDKNVMMKKSKTIKSNKKKIKKIKDIVERQNNRNNELLCIYQYNKNNSKKTEEKQLKEDKELKKSLKKINQIFFPPIKNSKVKENYSIIKSNELSSNKSSKKLEVNNLIYYNSIDKVNVNTSLFINENDINKYINIMKFTDNELNTLTYEEALKLDKRTYLEYYFSLLKTKHLFLFTFYLSNDYNSRIIKIDLFFFTFVIHYTINALFFNDATIHQIYEDGGSFNFIYQIPQVLYSSIISCFINLFVKALSLSEKYILELKHEDKIENLEDKSKQFTKCLNYRFIIYFSISYIFLLFFLYYLACFCAVYKNTQSYLLKDTVISFGSSSLYPIGINLIPGILRIPSLKAPKKNKTIMYNISKVIQII